MSVTLETFHSTVLQGNPLGDPADRRIPVYLPPGYEDSDRRYPVLFFLTGFTGKGTMFLNERAFEETLPQRLDRLIGAGQVQPLIGVMPDCFTRYGGSQYLNSAATGRYEDHLIDELVPWVDKTWRTRGTKSSRAVAGKSSGGYGAIVHGMRHPDVFGHVLCASGDMYFEYAYWNGFLDTLVTMGKYGGLNKFMETIPTIRPKDQKWFSLLNTVGMASSYAPNPASPYGFDLPLDERTGALLPEVWARWKAWDPVTMVDTHLDALRSLDSLYIECGNRDEFHLQFGARMLVDKLKAANVRHHYEEFDDGHMNIDYRWDVSLPALNFQ
ncbi:MAG TPA: alpha/beta hydrolase-fold protein [Candidatus Xenobia bacterium]|jgi:enterochelin esterase family protein